LSTLVGTVKLYVVHVDFDLFSLRFLLLIWTCNLIQTAMTPWLPPLFCRRPIIFYTCAYVLATDVLPLYLFLQLMKVQFIAGGCWRLVPRLRAKHVLVLAVGDSWPWAGLDG
jgi:hypothetical protein